MAIRMELVTVLGLHISLLGDLEVSEGNGAQWGRAQTERPGNQTVGEIMVLPSLTVTLQLFTSQVSVPGVCKTRVVVSIRKSGCSICVQVGLKPMMVPRAKPRASAQ